jgi:CheY-like chemotaxis protein
MMKILLIDDDSDDQTLFCDAIRNISSDIICEFAENGAVGLKLMNSEAALPDVVFLDVNMPIMDGRETLAIIRTTPRLSNLRVVIYSTSNAKEDVAWFASKSDSYVVKPNDFDSLVQLLAAELTQLSVAETDQILINNAC